MNPVFLDTSGLIAVVNTDDQWHASAEHVWGDLIAANARLNEKTGERFGQTVIVSHTY